MSICLAKSLQFLASVISRCEYLIFSCVSLWHMRFTCHKCLYPWTIWQFEYEQKIQKMNNLHCKCLARPISFWCALGHNGAQIELAECVWGEKEKSLFEMLFTMVCISFLCSYYILGHKFMKFFTSFITILYYWAWGLQHQRANYSNCEICKWPCTNG